MSKAESDIKINTVVRRAEGLLSSQVDGETVLMSIASGFYFGLDEIGSSIWKYLQEPQTIKSICDRLMDDYEIHYVECEEDVLEFIQELFEEGLIELQNNETP